MDPRRVILYGYYRSSASYRVRIALNLKGVRADNVARHLRKGEHKAAEFLKLNPQGLVPALATDDGTVLTQSLAIVEWLNEIRPSPPLLPADPQTRARVRAFACVIACEVHPLQNIGVLNRLRTYGLSDERVAVWAREVTEEGLDACEKLVQGPSPFAFGDAPSLADICLVPQLYNARRYGCDLARWPRLSAIDAKARATPAFANAAPERQPDAE